jgi:hypothetical protein
MKNLGRNYVSVEFEGYDTFPGPRQLQTRANRCPFPSLILGLFFRASKRSFDSWVSRDSRVSRFGCWKPRRRAEPLAQRRAYCFLDGFEGVASGHSSRAFNHAYDHATGRAALPCPGVQTLSALNAFLRPAPNGALAWRLRRSPCSADLKKSAILPL